MPVTIPAAAVYIAPVVIKTFFTHGIRLASRWWGKRDEEARDDLLFDQAFNIVKAFIDMGTENTIESLQAFTNTPVPAPYWAAVSPVMVPLSLCNQAADIMIGWFGPEELDRVVGGERWWQIRSMGGVEAEWVAEREYLDSRAMSEDSERTADEENILRMEHLETTMLYIHGGGYFWGSIHTHLYQIIRYGSTYLLRVIVFDHECSARKIKGRVFAVNYRKAPQYPWPCPLQDVIAAYLYLIRPPAGALHQPISPSKIVFAGDSAGGGICLSVLTTLRDMGLPMPAGAVLISPWVDLTHSFPSIMENTRSDIIPEYGFLAKPSTLWPVDPLPKEGGRVIPSQSYPEIIQSGKDVERSGDGGKSQEPNPPRILMEDPNKQPMELQAQLQVYAQNEQLVHPLVSPVLQGSLGNLPPLYIIAGNSEVLRDEIVYTAHRAAFPHKFPTRQGILREGSRQKLNAETYTTPTQVHLQVFDGMCHVLTVFTFTDSAKYAYDSIARFTTHVTSCSSKGLERNPFPEQEPPSDSTSNNQQTGWRNLACLRLKKYNRESPIVTTVGDRENAPYPHHPTPIVDNGDNNTPAFLMIRQRVDIHGRIRAMESMEDLPVLKLRPAQIGLMKEAPTMRWLKGQGKWDARFKHEAAKALAQRRHFETVAEQLLDNASKDGLVLTAQIQGPTHGYGNTMTRSLNPPGGQRWGPLDLSGERPPPSAIAGRRDTPDALELLKTIIHSATPRQTAHNIVFSNESSNMLPSSRHISERLHTCLPLHGLRMWDISHHYFRPPQAPRMDLA
ncbi:Alpha/Beta hydrolase protein [Infundibulicybe gibba]|nr:Alpha/Beta hydrolase protein [Infundibulicybe gibba]